jgi:hypothetical protein
MGLKPTYEPGDPSGPLAAVRAGTAQLTRAQLDDMDSRRSLADLQVLVGGCSRLLTDVVAAKGAGTAWTGSIREDRYADSSEQALVRNGVQRISSSLLARIEQRRNANDLPILIAAAGRMLTELGL